MSRFAYQLVWAFFVLRGKSVTHNVCTRVQHEQRQRNHSNANAMCVWVCVSVIMRQHTTLVFHCILLFHRHATHCHTALPLAINSPRPTELKLNRQHNFPNGNFIFIYVHFIAVSSGAPFNANSILGLLYCGSLLTYDSHTWWWRVVQCPSSPANGQWLERALGRMQFLLELKIELQKCPQWNASFAGACSHSPNGQSERNWRGGDRVWKKSCRQEFSFCLLLHEVCLHSFGRWTVFLRGSVVHTFCLLSPHHLCNAIHSLWTILVVATSRLRATTLKCYLFSHSTTPSHSSTLVLSFCDRNCIRDWSRNCVKWTYFIARERPTAPRIFFFRFTIWWCSALPLTLHCRRVNLLDAHMRPKIRSKKCFIALRAIKLHWHSY